jgi:type III secretory pathway component EscT
MRASVLIMYAAGVGFGLLAIVSTRLNPAQLIKLAVIVLICLVAAIALLERLPYEQQDPRSESPS